MTTPRERTCAIQQLEAVALAILDETKQAYLDKERVYVHIPCEILRSLAAALRHYPTASNLLEAHKGAPDVFGAPS